MKSTPWVKNHSAVTSDLLTGSRRPGKKGKGREVLKKGTQSLKSKEVQRIERLINSIESNQPSPWTGKEACFCKARTHELSSYTPICTHCGLILCLLHHPSRPCPHCHSSLLSESAHAALIARLRRELEVVLKKEADAQEAARQERLDREIEAAGGGSFPILASTTNSRTPLAPPTHKVLSLNSKTKKVTVASFSPAPRPSGLAHSTSQSEVEDDEFSGEGLQPRVPPPPEHPPFVTLKGNGRRWENLRGGGPLYVQPPRIVQGWAESEPTKKRRKPRAKTSVLKDSEAQDGP